MLRGFRRTVFAACAARAYPRPGMAARFVTTTVVALLIPALALLCLGDVVQAALPNDESMECATKVSMGEAASVDHRNDPRLVLLGRRRPRYGCGITSYLDDCFQERAAPGT